VTWLDDTIKRVRDFDAQKPRSQQAQVGWSEVGGCRSYLGFKLEGAWQSDEPDTWGAQRGTAIHEYLCAIAALEPGVRTELDTEYRGIPGHADIVEPCAVTDIKGLALTTPLPTPEGWTTMATVQVGDHLFGSDGKPCTVTAKSETKQIGTYVVRFKDGARVVCDREHLWLAMRGQTVQGRMEVVGVTEMAASVMKFGQVNWRVPVTEPLALPDADLPVKPYVLGCWLGDGSVGNSRITGTPDIFAELEREGCRIGEPPPSQRDKAAPFRNAYGLMTLLRRAGVLFDKHIPDPYLRSSASQRQALVQGLMDTDGTWNKPRKRAAFFTTSKRLADGMFELLVSLGEKPSINWHAAHGFGVITEVCQIEWSPTRFVPFRLQAKAGQVVSSDQKAARGRWRTISAIEPGPDVSTACIAVDSPDSTYLCGREMIPTHNTTKLANSRLWAEKTRVLRPKRVQAHGYAAGLVDAGELPEDATVRLLVVPVDGTFADWWSWEEQFDRSLADEGADRLDEVRSRLLAGEWLPKDEPYWFCQDWCEFFSVCRGGDDPKADEMITDPELAAMIAAYGEAAQQATAADKVKKALAPQIRGLRGTTEDGWKVSTGRGGEPSDVIDEAAVIADYAARGFEVPMTTKPGNAPRLLVSRPKVKAEKP
jgi:hypothetical protein